MSSEDFDQIKKKKSQNRSAVRFDFNKLHFPSQPNDSFRVRASTCSEGVTLWVECVKTKQQWQVTVKKVCDCGPSGIPDDVVYTLLEEALGDIESGDPSQNDCEVDLSNSDKGILLTLQLVLGRVWRPEFVFNLLPVALEKVDLLEARLRDAHDEIEFLRAGGATHYLSLSSKTACAPNQMVVWDGDGPLMSASHFRQSENLKRVIVLKTGVYQISISLGGRNNNSGQSTALQLNGIDVAVCMQSESNGQQNAAHIQRIVKLNANDVLQVKCGFNLNSETVQAGNSFSILFLSL